MSYVDTIINKSGTKAHRRLAVVPSDPLAAYDAKGNSYFREDYYNPNNFFSETFCLSPLEDKEHFKYGMHVIPTTAEQLPGRIRDLGIDVVRAYGGYWACDYACENKVEGVPVVVSVHDTNPKILHESIHKADYVFAVSQAVKNLLIEKGVSQSKISILPNRVDLNIFRYMSDTQKKLEFSRLFPGKYRVLHVGRKTEQKNLDTVIRSLPYLGSDYSAIFIGIGDKFKYEQLAKDLNVIDRCYFIDSVPNINMASYYSFCDCMCTPSRWEGFGIVFLEALACQAIVVTSDIAPMNELIIDGYNGLLVKDYESPNEMAKTIKVACTDTYVRSHLFANARNVTAKFDKQAIDQLESNLYEHIIEGIKISKANHKNEIYGKKLPIYRALTEYNLSDINVRHSAELLSKLKEYGMDNPKLDAYWDRVSFIATNCYGNVLEIGCGCGNVTRYISQNTRVSSVTAIDQLPEYIEILRNYNYVNVKALCADVLNFETYEKFDCIVIAELIEHLSQVEENKIISILNKILKINSKIIITTPIGFMPDPDHVRGFTPEEFVSHLTHNYGIIEKLGDNGIQQFAVVAKSKFNDPLVTVVLPTYNHLSFLPKSIESLLLQTFTEFELIIVNDGSTDGTMEFLDSLSDPRIRIIHQKNSRLPLALNAGFKIARGQLLTWTSADNYCAPHFLEAFVSAFNNHPEAGFAYSAFAWINEDGQITGVHQNQDVSWANMIKANPGLASFMYRKECHVTLGWYDSDLEGAEDWDMWLRIIERYQAIYVPEMLYYYRIHNNSMTATKTSLIAASSQKTKIKASERQKGHNTQQVTVQHVTPEVTLLLPSEREVPFGYSFCIITNGKRLAKLRAELDSIRALAIPNYEILIAGELPLGMTAEGFAYYPMPDAARNGRLGEMRNLLCAKARYNHLIVCDDDLLFQTDFYQGLARFGEDYDVLCVKLLNADGTRYWSWATVGGPKGHVLLEYNETDPFLYVTGGLCIMKSWVAGKVQWDPVRGMNELEDVDFSRRLQAAGIRIDLCPDATVIHNDWRITQVGKQVFRIDVDFERAATFCFSQSWDDGMDFIYRVFKTFPGNTELKQRITAFAASYRAAGGNATSGNNAPGCTIAPRYLHHSAERDLLGTHIQYLREIQNALLDKRPDTGRNMLLSAESLFEEDSKLLTAAGVLSILAGLNQLAVHFIERSSEYKSGNPQTVMYELIASLHASNEPVVQEKLKQHLKTFPQLNGELDIDQLLNFVTVTLHDVEYVALGMPPQQIRFIQKGAEAAVETKWDDAIAYYKKALEAADASELFDKPLHTKISFLDNTLNQEISVFPTSETVIPAHVSRLCTEAEFAEPDYKKLCEELQIAPNHYHRKCWEYYFVAKGVSAAGLLRGGTRGICFGAGREVLISYFARHGCNITATDLEPDEMTKANWMDTNQHADSLADLLYPQICPPDLFNSHVDFQYADMNSISDSFMQEQYDFSWSCCAFEHLGSIEQGKQFILNQMKCLKPGGVALHTTEFNIMSDVLTIDHTPTVLFRKCDIEEIARQLRNEGHTIEINYSAGAGCVDGYVDIPPYMQKADSWHLRLLLNKYIITSIGLFITKTT
ncbi:MAG: glycosyltransferase [Desulfuromonadaceae bacterium]|nr:glycosyltransferase [Desulfuromonadaceae bacterium]MDD2849526.1 glycosyltransferase [Desulfuromonadaceae bacterium]MDD4131952.1 glycosyltransferase [Desulfuromonadaceae bacterium]